MLRDFVDGDVIGENTVVVSGGWYNSWCMGVVGYSYGGRGMNRDVGSGWL